MNVFKTLQYLKYSIRANTRHGIHSPFVYDFIENVLRKTNRVDFMKSMKSHYPDYTFSDDFNNKTDGYEQHWVVRKNIHQSKSAHNQWKQLVANNNVHLSIDVFDYGLLCFSKDFKEKQHFVLKRSLLNRHFN